MHFDTLPFNWFDLLIGIVLVVGMHQGRKHGFSEELLPTIKWFAIVFGCALLYEPVGANIARSPVFSLLSSYLMAYFAAALVIAVAFALIKKLLGGKLLGSDVFGRGEFYLGMFSGMVRFCCILIVGLALLNARRFNAMEIQAQARYQNDVYGSNFFPTFSSVQAQVFERSLAGPWIRQNLGVVLIKPTAPEDKQLKQKEYVVP